MDFNYKKYSLEKLEEWMHDAISCGEATPQEIYDTIKSVVEENYHIYKNHTERCYELLALLNGNGKAVLENMSVCDKDDPSPECKESWNDFWEENYYPEESKNDNVVKWVLPIEVDGLTGDCIITFPDDLLQKVGWKEGDQLEFLDLKNGSFQVKKVK